LLTGLAIYLAAGVKLKANQEYQTVTYLLRDKVPLSSVIHVLPLLAWPDYALDNRGFGVDFFAEARYFSFF
jgi:hypothetical protein